MTWPIASSVATPCGKSATLAPILPRSTSSAAMPRASNTKPPASATATSVISLFFSMICAAAFPRPPAPKIAILILVFLQYEYSDMPAETIRQTRRSTYFHFLPARQTNVSASAVRDFQIQIGRREILLHRQQAEYGLDRARCAEQVAGQGFTR